MRTRRSSGEGIGAELSLMVMDLHSTNSTKINGKRIKPNRWMRVEVGDELQLGETKFTVRLLR